MKILVEVSEKDYLNFLLQYDNGILDEKTPSHRAKIAIANGIPLPKGHGALKDVSKFLYECKLDYGCERICDCTNCVHHVIRERDVGNALTIIEADKEGAEE